MQTDSIHAAPAACGFNSKKDLPTQHSALNSEVAAKIKKGEAAVAPGGPKNYSDAKKLVTADCTQPAQG